MKFVAEDIWLTQNHIALLYKTTQQNISLHIKNIYKDGELLESSTHKNFLLVQKEGNRKVKRNIGHYNLDMATEKLHEYIQKSFALDDDRLKQGGNRYFRELLQRIRDIRKTNYIDNLFFVDKFY